MSLIVVFANPRETAAPFLKSAYKTVFEFAKIAIFRSITLYKSAEMVVTVRGCCKRVHVGDVGTPLMGRTDGALDHD